MVHMDRECSSSLKSDYSSSLANDDHHDEINSRDIHIELDDSHHEHLSNSNEDIVGQHHQHKQLDTSHSDHDSIILYPFAHQVGGHTQLLTLDKGTLCKPLIPRELLFYMNVPKELVKFLPAYKGVVQIRENGAGSYPPVLYQPLRSPKSPFARYGPGSSYTLPAKLNGGFLSQDNSQSITDLSGSPLELKVSIRQCSDENILRKNLSDENLLASNYISRPNEKYLLLLENVAANYQFPCILDLKMGTRQHGEDATEEKRHRQIAKCQASTSASLGVRLCGMQVYQVDHGGFLWYDKYYGRKMNEQGLKRALHQYFYNGFQINKDIIDDVIARLKLLQKAVERSPSFRFYGTSLLIIHEGYSSRRSSVNTCPIDVRLIDFAHTICDYSYPNPTTPKSTTTTNNNNNTTTTNTKLPKTNNNCNNHRSSSSPCVLRSSSVERLRFDYSQLQQQTTTTPDDTCTSSVDLNMINALSAKPASSDDHQSMATKQQQQTSSCIDENAITTESTDYSAYDHHSQLPPQPISIITPNNNNNNNHICNNNNIIVDENFDDIAQMNQITEAYIPDDNNPHTDLVSQDGDEEDGNDDDQNQRTIDKEQDHISKTMTAATTTTTTTTTTNTTTTSNKLNINNRTLMGPDKGLLFGLQNLMRLLEDLKEDYQIDHQIQDQTQAPREKAIENLYIPVV